MNVPAAIGSQYVGANPGQIAGVINAGGYETGFLYSGGDYTTINPPGFAGATINGIKASGQIVGSGGGPCSTAGCGFLYSGGSYTTIVPPGSVNGSNAFGINNSGQVVGNVAPGTLAGSYGTGFPLQRW